MIYDMIYDIYDIYEDMYDIYDMIYMISFMIYIIYDILVSFMMNKMSFLLISNIFSDFSFKRDQRMERQTDRASYRDAMAHLKKHPSIFLNHFQ